MEVEKEPRDGDKKESPPLQEVIDGTKDAWKIIISILRKVTALFLVEDLWRRETEFSLKVKRQSLSPGSLLNFWIIKEISEMNTS